MSESILLQTDGAVATILLNRPDVLNAFNLEMGRELRDAIREVKQNPGIKMLVLSGAGRAFSAGGDIKAMAALNDHPAFFREISEYVHEAVLMIREMPQPVIASLSGPVSGMAFGLVTSCDIRIASETTVLQAGTTRLGLAANGGLSYFLPRLIGRGRAAQVVMMAEAINAEQAFAWGLVNQVVPAAELGNAVQALCEQMLALPTRPLAEWKRLLKESDHDLAEQLEREREAIALSSDTDDFREGIAAFVEKRSPHFRDN